MFVEPSGHITGSIGGGKVEYEAISHCKEVKEKEVKLTNKEFELLKFMAMHPNIVFSKEQLFEKIWGLDYLGDSATIMVHINRIREKIEDDPKNPKLLETIWGAGYHLNKTV